MLHRAWLLLLCLLASSLVATATVHAQESAPTAEISCSGTAHAEDGDQMPADADQGLPHHHGTCHGHAFAVDSLANVLAVPLLSSLRPIPQPGADPALRAIDPALRPPRA